MMVVAPCRPDESGPQRVEEMADHHLRSLLATQIQGETVSRLILVAPRLWSRYSGLRRLSAWAESLMARR